MGTTPQVEQPVTDWVVSINTSSTPLYSPSAPNLDLSPTYLLATSLVSR